MRWLIGGFILILVWSFSAAGQIALPQNSSHKQSDAPEQVYELSVRPVPLLVGGSLLYSYGNNLIRAKTPLTEQDLLHINQDAVYAIDRFAVRLWSPTFSKISDFTFLLSACSTPVLFLSKEVREEWFTIGFMYLQASVLSFGAVQTTKGLTQRLRPYVYNPAVPIEEKLTSDAKNSFFSGHTALTATYSFLSYKIYSDFFPNSEWKPYVLAGAMALPLLTGASRILAGKHYLTDVLVGYGVGALVGYGLPLLYKKKEKKKPSFAVYFVPVLY